jgi:hypothetical protein
MNPDPNSAEPNPPNVPDADRESTGGLGNRQPAKLDAAGRQRVCDVLTVGGTLEMAADLVGCTVRAIRYAAKRDPVFRERILQARQHTAYDSLKIMSKAAEADPDKNWRAAYYHARMVYPERYHRPANSVPVKQVQKLIDHAVGQVVQNTLRILDDTVTDRQLHEQIGRRMEVMFQSPRRRNK